MFRKNPESLGILAPYVYLKHECANYDQLRKENQSVLDIIREVIANAGSVAAGSAGIAIAASELTRGMMVIASYLREKLLEPQRKRYREEGKEKGRAEGHQEMAARWREWNRRRLNALENGEEFNEPPPGEEQPFEDSPGQGAVD